MIAVMLAVALAVQDPPKAEEGPRAELIKKQVVEALALLEKESPSDQRRGRDTLADMGRAAEAALVKRLGEDGVKAQVRVLVCNLLGEIRAASPEARLALTARLTDSEYFGTSVASRAAAALGVLGDAAAIEPLAKALEASATSNDVALRYEAILALGRLRALDSIGAIQKHVTDDKAQTDLDQWVASAAIQAMVMLEARGSAEALAIALDNDKVDEWGPFPDWKIQELAVWALEHMVEADQWPRKGKSIVDAPESERPGLVSEWKAWRNNRAAVVETRAALTKVQEAVESYKKDTGKLPADLMALTMGEKKYVAAEAGLLDGWKTRFEYHVPGWGAEYDLVSLGADRARGGSGQNADVWSHDQWEKVGAEKTALRLKGVAAALEQHKSKNGTYPADLAALKTADPALETNDGWGGALAYKPSTDRSSFSLVSRGYDGKEGGQGPDKDVDLKDLPK